MVAAGTVGIWLHRRVLEARFLLAFGMVIVVGIGSVAFHGSLRFELQLLDELPMLYSALVLVFILLENQAQRRFGAWFPLLLTAHALLVTYLTASTRGTLQFYLFQTSFITLEAFALYRVYQIYRKSSEPELRKIYRLGMALYAAAVVAWLCDLKACSFLNVTLPAVGIPNPQLHAVWHVLVSAGLYLLVLSVALDRLRVLGQNSVLRYFANVVPYAALTKKRHAARL
jgi:dihydroceramidase